MFLCELALELGMPIGEMCDRMSLHELSVTWPAFFVARKRDAEREAQKAQKGR